MLTASPVPIAADCAGLITTTSCTEHDLPPGQWSYSVRPVQHGWYGSEGPPGNTVSVDAPSLTLSPTAVTTLPSTLTGGVASYLTGESVTFRLDDPNSGPVLVGGISPDPVPSGGSASVSVTLPAGTSVGSHTIYAVGSGGTVAGAIVSVSDGTPPSIAAAVIGKTQGGSASFIRQGGTYYVYANVSDPGDPATGVATVSADVSAITTGQTAVPLVAGTYVVEGTTYGYRSAAITANPSLASGPKAFSITAVDGAGNAATQTGFTVMVDNTRPTATDVQTANASGGVIGRAETGDTITFTFSEPIEPGSILAGWDGSATTVTVRLVNNAAGDRVQVWNAANTTQLPFGTVNLGRTDYVSTTRTFTGSTMVMSGSTITVTLGSPSGAVGTAAASGTISWTPTATPYDRAANACLTTTVTESGPADPEF